jgi:hypothetical protein
MAEFDLDHLNSPELIQFRWRRRSGERFTRYTPASVSRRRGDKPTQDGDRPCHSSRVSGKRAAEASQHA